MSVERFEEAYNIVKPTLGKLGLSEEEIRDYVARLFTPTAEENSAMIKSLLGKLNT